MRMIVQTLREMGEDVSCNIHAINAGGCCVYAAYVGKQLEKLGYDVRGCTSSTRTNKMGNVDEARPFINNHNNRYEWNEHHIEFSHVFLEVKIGDQWYWHDSNDTVVAEGKNFSYRRIYDGRFTIAELDGLAYGPASWNPTFRRNQIPALKRIIRSHLVQPVVQLKRAA